MGAERRRTFVAGLLFLGLAAGYYALADRLPRGILFEQIGSDAIPKLLALLMAGLAVLLVAVELVSPATDAAEHGPDNRAAFLGTLAVLALTAPLWVLLGFLATPLLMAGTMVVNGTRRPATVLLVSAVGTVVLYLVFFRLFAQEVPLGMLRG